MSTELREVNPDPARMVEGLRDTGYKFNTAVADVVDNSIAAGACNVAVELRMNRAGDITLKIFDDGIGMDRDGIADAMRYGAKARASLKSLGKFGLGLKTASTAFCRSLSIISRSEANAELVRATWDLDRIKAEGKWNLVLDAPSEQQVSEFNKLIPDGRGTMVIWDKVDRVLKNYDVPGGGSARKALEKIEDGLRLHFSTVYQRFLDETDARERTVRMRLNGQDVLPWDPFCVKVSLMAKENTVPVELPDGTAAEFSIRAYVLPRKEEFESDVAAKAARLTNANQGIYVYRENRMIHGPTWLEMFSKEPHMTLLRIEFSFDYRLDEAFQIDIKKSQIILDESLAQYLQDFVTPVRRAAEDAYRTGHRKVTHKNAAGAHDVSNRNIASKAAVINQPAVTSTDEERGEVTLSNTKGLVRLKLRVSQAASPTEIFVQTVETIEDGLLWKPAVIRGDDGKQHFGVQINTGHPYYSKVYLPNLSEGVIVQGMDALLWGLCISEMNCVSDDNKRMFEDLRFEVSRNLKKLVEDLPEAKLDA